MNTRNSSCSWEATEQRKTINVVSTNKATEQCKTCSVYHKSAYARVLAFTSFWLHFFKLTGHQLHRLVHLGNPVSLGTLLRRQIRPGRMLFHLGIHQQQVIWHGFLSIVSSWVCVLFSLTLFAGSFGFGTQVPTQSYQNPSTPSNISASSGRNLFSTSMTPPHFANPSGGQLPTTSQGLFSVTASPVSINLM